MSRFSTSRCIPRKNTETMNHHRWQRHNFQWIWAPSMVTIVCDIRDVERMIMTYLNETKPQTRLHLTPNGQTPLLGRLGDLCLVILNPVVEFDWRFTRYCGRKYVGKSARRNPIESSAFMSHRCDIFGCFRELSRHWENVSNIKVPLCSNAYLTPRFHLP